MKKAVIFVAIVFIIAGCLKPITNLGCCQKENISEGCVLYNTTDFSLVDLINDTVVGSCDNPIMQTEGYCNVSINGEFHLIPICTQDQKVPCVDPNCTAMICGDFEYKPRVAPGVQSEETMAEDAAPTNMDDDEAMLFYKGQCRFLPMDAKLRNIMKSSKSQINVFRVGVGESFDEYDQYRYYFPMSDKFCSAVREPEEPVDRYMNYLNPVTMEPYYPLDEEDGIIENCFNESNVLPPFSYTDSIADNSTGDFGRIEYDSVVPELHNYRLAHNARYNYNSTWYDEGYYWYIYGYWNEDSVYKKIDKEFYRRELSIAYADTIYNLGGTGTTKAPFECEMAGGDCYSGTCDTATYNRGTLVEATEDPERPEIVADCYETSDENGNDIVLCSSLKTVTLGDPGEAPERTYAMMSVRPSRLLTNTYGTYWGTALFGYSALADEDGIEALKNRWGIGWIEDSLTGASYMQILTTETATDVRMVYKDKRDCPADYGTFEDDDPEGNEEAPCFEVEFDEDTDWPPATGTVFFGKLGDNVLVYPANDSEKIVIGYSLATPSEFEDTLLAKNCELVEGVDYEVVDIGEPTEWNESGLVDAFKPYFGNTLETYKTYGFADGCGNAMPYWTLQLSQLPWVVNFDKGLLGANLIILDEEEKHDREAYYLGSTAAYAERMRNTYNENATDTMDDGSCNLRRHTGTEFEAYYGFGIYGFGMGNPVYNVILYSKYLILLKYEPGSKKIGNCAVDDITYRPEVKTFGWCEPCTTSTLAYQKIETTERVYMPGYSVNIEDAEYNNEERLCEAKREWDWSFMGYDTRDNVSCFSPYISDIDDYQGSIGGIGSPRTIPDATVIKERMGDYLKSGVMPIIDMSDASNWEKSNPDAEKAAEDENDTYVFWLNYDEDPTNYSEYDFEALLGDMGAVVVIVDNVTAANAAIKRDQIIERAFIIREKCFGCLVAFHVINPASNESFSNAIRDVIVGPDAIYNIDLVTFDYEVSEHSDVSSEGAEAVVDDIASYGKIALQTKNKPTMLIGLNVRSDDPVWDETNYGELFDMILLNQNKLINSGILGIIYAPVRSTMGGEGVVDETLGLGIKTPKFCALQGAMQKMSGAIPVSIFTKTVAVEDMECIPCTSWDKLPGGICEYMDYSAQTCDDGNMCIMPEMMMDFGNDYKCPENAVTVDCPLCNETGTTFECTYTYANGSTREISGDMNDITSDIWMDVMAGFSKPNKCCLQDEASGALYTFIEKAYQTPVNQPAIFPKSGYENVDCGFGSTTSQIGEISTFCGLQQSPIRDYTIECSYS
ncbi:hypothetical protein KKB44_03345 [Candidatus Micrarchaeota archaeon]|nr:hypothetical protein [Candidatus Micrarchaeota archaeon]